MLAVPALAAVLLAAPVGVPHAGMIDRIALTPDGGAAVTRDSTGGVRVWLALDREPFLISIPDADRLSVARAGTGLRVVAVDASGGITVVGVGADGAARTLGGVPPSPRALDAAALPGGGFVALHDDHAIHLYDDAGHERARLDKRDFAARRLLVAGDALVAVAGDDKSSLARRATFQNGALAWDGLPPLIVDAGIDGMFALSLDGKVLAWTAPPAKNPADVTFASFAVRKAHPVRVGPLVPTGLGFIDDERLVITAQGNALSVDAASGSTDKLPILMQQGLAPSAFAPGLRATSYGTFLALQRLSGPAPKTSYVGYRPQASPVGALSPSGTLLAVADGTALSIEEHGVTTALAASPRPLKSVAFLDDDRLIVIDDLELRAVRWRTGEVIASAPVPFVGFLAAEPSTGLIMVKNPQGPAAVYELSAHELLKREVPPAMSAALLRAATPDDPALVLTNATGSRTFTRAELAGESRKHRRAVRPPVAGDMSPAMPPPPAPMAWDARGNRWLITAASDGAHLRVDRPEGAGALDNRLSFASVSYMAVSPAGDAAILFTEHGWLAVRPDGSRLWSFGQLSVMPSWSADGSRVALIGRGGIEILDPRTGDTLSQHCGGTFVILDKQPDAWANDLSICTR